MLCCKCPLCLCDAIPTQGHPWEGAQGEPSSKVHIGEWVLHDVEQMPTMSHSRKQSPCAIPPTSSERLPWAHNMVSQHRGYGGEKKTVPIPCVWRGRGEERRGAVQKRPVQKTLSLSELPWHVCCASLTTLSLTFYLLFRREAVWCNSKYWAWQADVALNPSYSI